MIDDFTARTRVIRAAFALAERSGWRALSLNEIAQEAGVSLTDIRQNFTSKQDILRAFSAEVDRAVLRQASPDASEPARDRLFEVLITRFEVMAPFKGALRAIAHDLRFAPLTAACLVDLVARSQYWMLSAAGIDAEPPLGAFRIPGLAGVYGKVMRVWFDDDDPGLARTMAALDKELRQGERVLTRLEGACRALLCFGRTTRRTTTTPHQRQEPDPDEDSKPVQGRPSTGPGPTAAYPIIEPYGPDRD